MLKSSEYTVQLSIPIKEEGENCRMCLESDGEFISLESSFETLSANPTYWDAFNFCTNLNAQSSDSLPKIICIDCASNLTFVFDVLKKAEHSDQVLRQVLGKQLVIGKLNQEFNEELVIKKLTEESNESIENADDADCDDNDMEELIYLEDSGRDSGDEERSSQPEVACDLCGDVFPTEEDLAQHIQVHNEEEAHDVVLSEDETQSTDDLPEKITKQPPRKSPTRKYICEICGKCFTSNQKLKAHTFVHTKEKNFACDLCPKRFTTIFRHREHMRTHANIRPHECSFCKQRFFSKHTLVCHMRRHTGERPYKCEICGKSFTQNSIMKTHAALHTGKTVECPHCFKKFSRPSHLILHQRSHTGERPYVCHLCSNSYKQKSHLDRHLDTHMGVKHTCEICGKEYSKKSSLNTHMFVHADVKPFKCDTCGMDFVTKDKFQRHLKNSHKTVFKIQLTDVPNDTSKPETADDPRLETLS